MYDYPHNKKRVKGVIDRCRSTWCDKCRKPEFRKKVIPRLKAVAELWAGVRKLVITTDPKRFPQGCTADVLAQLLREKSDFERRLKDKYHGKIHFMFSWIEFQESGFPHWHYLIFTDQKGKKAMIGQELVHLLWDRYLNDEDLKKSNQWIREGYFKSKREYLYYMGYAEKTGYFMKEKAHQVKLPPLLMASKRKIRAYYFSIKFGDSLKEDNSSLPEDNSVSTEIKEENEDPEYEDLTDKEKIRASFELCPKNIRDRFGSNWRLRYTEEVLEAIGDEIREQERQDQEDIEDIDIPLFRQDLTNEEKQARCGKRIRFIYFTENFKYLGKSDFIPYDDGMTYILREKYMVEEQGKGLFFKSHVHDEQDAAIELREAFLEFKREQVDGLRKLSEKIKERKNTDRNRIPEQLKIFEEVFPGSEIIVEKEFEERDDDELFAPYIDYNSADEYLKSKENN